LKQELLFCFFLSLFCTDASFGQKNNAVYLQIHSAVETKGLIKYESEHSDSLAIVSELKGVLNQLQGKSYMAATYDSIVWSVNSVNAYLYVGKPLQWASLSTGNVDEEAVNRSGFRERLYTQRHFNPQQLQRLFRKIIVFYENNGYPFAMIALDSVQYHNEGIQAVLRLTKHQQFVVDTVKIFGNTKVAPAYLYNYLGVHPGEVYNENNVKKIGQRIQELAFVKAVKPYNVAFTKTETVVNLYLDKRNANRFDGIIGLLPNEDDSKIEITGDLKLKLQNSFNRGEQIDFNWRRLVNKSQDLKLKFNYPYIFNTLFGVDFDFKLYRRDTLFIDLQTKYGVQYAWRANNYLKAYVNNRNANLLSTKAYENTTVLPPYADIRAQLYGMEVKLEKLNYRLNPKRGYALLLSAETGTKKIKRNNALNPEIYEGLQLNSSLYNLMGQAGVYFPLSKLMVIHLGNQSGYTFNANAFENELFRIGGLNILRGFDEESILASFYAVNTFEYRILLEQNSYWYLFFDGAYYENKNVTLSQKITDTPFGFGTGITFQTKSGIFSLNYALGKQFNNPILFRSSKVHFGFVNYF
jgi:outer membrane protein assembly factor BamA